MARLWTKAAALAAGAGCMALLDPHAGRRRRTQLRESSAKFLRQCAHDLRRGWRDLESRAAGLACEVTARLRSDAPPDDATLQARVRSRLGHLASHAHAVRVHAANGHVILSGRVAAAERASIATGVARVRGVRSVENHMSGDSEGEAAAKTPASIQPSLDAIGGAALLAYGLSGRRRFGVAASVAGAGLLARSFLAAARERSHGIAIEKVVNIDADVGKVYGYWSQLTNFPKFMSHVREVADRGHGRYHWIVDGPAGLPISWDAVLTRNVAGELIAWASVPGATIESQGAVCFRSNDDGGTRVHVRMSYKPAAGRIGHGVAKLFGVDPKRQMDDDLARLKRFLETGTLPRDAYNRPPAHPAFH